jgi:hypothetical protein
VAELHRDDAPLALTGVSPQELGYHRIMTIGENVGLDQHLVADRALDRIAPAVDRGPDRLDDRARRRRLYLFTRLIQA